MKINIRRNIFETNSSSTHSLCITNAEDYVLPKVVAFNYGGFGWECETYYSTEEKASYLYTALKNLDKEDELQHIIKTLENNGVAVICQKSEPFYHDIDHAGDLEEFITAVVEDDNILLKFLFSNDSFIITGNDNDDENVDIIVNYDHMEFYKGN